MTARNLLAQLTPFVGRQDKLAEIAALNTIAHGPLSTSGAQSYGVGLLHKTLLGLQVRIGSP